MRISDWSSDVCSSDLLHEVLDELAAMALDPSPLVRDLVLAHVRDVRAPILPVLPLRLVLLDAQLVVPHGPARGQADAQERLDDLRSEERRGGKECVSACRTRWSP